MFRPAVVFLIFAALIAVPSAAQGLSGTFSSAESVKGPSPSGLNLRFGRNSMSSVRLSDAERAAVPLNGAFQLTLRRDPGVIVLDGTAQEGRVAGHYTFEPSRTFLPALEQRGIAVGPHIDEQELLLLAILGLELDYVDELAKAGFGGLSFDRLKEFSIHRVSVPWIRAMREAGYPLSESEAVSFRIHRVSPELVRTYAANGYRNLSRSDLMSMAIHRVTPQFIEQMRSAGYTDLPASKLVEMRIHRVTPQYVRELRSLGYPKLSASKLVEMRIHRVDADFIRQVNERTGSTTPVDKLIKMRIHRIHPSDLN